jgi:hypothetical protein
MARWSALILLALTLWGCAPERRRAEPNPLEQPPIDSVRVGSLALVAGWFHREEASADLDGDGRDETVVLASDVELGRDDQPLWEDGHRWGLYAEGAGGERTLLYSAFVPNGRASAAILQPDDRGRRRVLVEERSASQLIVFEIEYDGPGKARLSSAAFSQVERWLAR